MARLMSFGLTEQAVIERQKTVTRRLGWLHAAPGQLIVAVDKAMGLRKGESPKTLAVIRVVAVRREPLNAITPEDVEAEGFPGQTPEQFIELFTRAMRCTPETEVTRIEFEYLTAGEIVALVRQDMKNYLSSLEFEPQPQPQPGEGRVVEFVVKLPFGMRVVRVVEDGEG